MPGAERMPTPLRLSTSGAMLSPDDPEWKERALCAQTDPEAFFPEKGGSDPGREAGLLRL